MNRDDDDDVHMKKVIIFKKNDQLGLLTRFNTNNDQHLLSRRGKTCTQLVLVNPPSLLCKGKDMIEYYQKNRRNDDQHGQAQGIPQK